MHMRHVQCPVCGTILRVPPGLSNCPVRCCLCHHRFRLPRRIAVTDEAVTEWLWQDRRREMGDDLDVTKDAEAQRAETEALSDAAASGKTTVLPALSDAIRLLRVDKKGALFEFPTSRLHVPTFRCAMPRKCVRCGTRTHLQAHLIVFSEVLRDSFSLEAEHAAGALSIRDPQLAHLDGEELLKHLPEVPNVPPPAHLPMPYWLCDMCSGAGMISGQIEIYNATGKGLCRLQIRHLARAEEFLVAAGGQGSSDHAKLQRRITAAVANPWQSISGSVQHRLGTWYKPQGGERFVAYVPDRDLGRSEDGMSGLVVTNHRLIYHTQLRHHEAKINEPLKFQLVGSTTRGQLRIKAPAWEVKRLTVDGDGVARLRRALTTTKFNAVWF